MPTSMEERLQQLERELSEARRRYRWLFAVLGVTVAVSVVAWTWMGTGRGLASAQAAAVQDTIRAHAFILMDSDGRSRGILSVRERGSALTLHDPSGVQRAMMVSASTEGTGGVFLNDESGEVRAALSLDRNQPALALLDATGERRAHLGVSRTTGVGLGLYDGTGVLRAAVGQSQGRWMFGIADDEQRMIWTAPR